MAYAALADLAELGIVSGAIASLSSGTRQEALDRASAELDGYLAARFALPLSSPYPTELLRRTVDVAVYLLMRHRGFNPDAANDQLIVKGYDDAIAWARGVARGEVQVIGALDGTSTVGEGAPEVETTDSRGW